VAPSFDGKMAPIRGKVFDRPIFKIKQVRSRNKPGMEKKTWMCSKTQKLKFGGVSEEYPPMEWGEKDD